jgi:hypothetical protein
VNSFIFLVLELLYDMYSMTHIDISPTQDSSSTRSQRSRLWWYWSDLPFHSRPVCCSFLGSSDNEFENVDHVLTSIIIESVIRHENNPVVEYVRHEGLLEDYACAYESTIGLTCAMPILQAMRKHPDDSNVRVAACGALCTTPRFDVIPPRS